MRKRATLTSSAILVALFSAVLTAYAQGTASTPDKTRFGQFKALEGEWTTTTGEKKKETMKVVYHVTSAGSAVTETIGPGTGEEMITIITKDGNDLALTHYCAMGNQPHMKAASSGEGNAVAFKFTGAGNLPSESDMHMHNVTCTFVDKNTLKSEWTMFSKGKASGTVTFLLKRSKPN